MLSKWGWMAALTLGAALCAAQDTTAPTDVKPASVAGTVTNSLTGAPLLRAHVSLRSMDNAPPQPGQPQGPQTFGALTNGEGKFTILQLQPGRYMVSLDRTGFVLPSGPGVRNLSLTLGPGDKKDDLKYSLAPTGAINGRVLDSAGEPMQSMAVMAEGGAGGGQSATTDDKGMFRLGGLRPGKYRVKATPQNLPLPPEVRTDGSPVVHYSATYFPSSLAEKTGTRVEVASGADLTGIDIRMVRTPIVTVSGKINGIPPGSANVNVVARNLATNNMNGGPGGPGPAKPDGTFAIWRLDPGRYVLTAIVRGTPVLQSSPVEIEVGTADIDHVELTMVPPFDIPGRMQFDDEAARQPQPPQTNAATGQQQQSQQQPAPPQAQPRRIMLRELDGSGYGGQMRPVDIGVDDSFTLEKVQPGRYRVTLSWPRVCVKSMTLGSVRMDGDILDLRNGSGGASLTAVASSNACEISGTVSDFNGPVVGAQVALAPEQSSGMNMQMTRTGADGSYKFQGVVPGKYKLLPADEDVQGLVNMRRSLDDYADITENLDLHAGDKVSKDLRQRASK